MLDKTIFTGFSPNITPRDTRMALGLLLAPNKWQSGVNVQKVEDWLEQYFSVHSAVAFDSGRSALLYALKALDVGEGDEVLVQAYTCVVVVNAIRFAGATPVYVDVRDDLNMDPACIEKRITDRTKAIIIQHTFGQPADLETMLPIVKKRGLKVIEDCAHSLGVRYQGKLTGTFADIGMFSFGSDKVVSCARGGALITNDPALAEQLHSYKQALPETGRMLVFQHLMHYPLFLLGRSLYHLGIGKWILAFAKRLHLMNRIIYRSEKQGRPPFGYPARLPNALAAILLNQFADLDTVQMHRQSVRGWYDAELPKQIRRQHMDDSAIPLRYTLFVSDVSQIHVKAKKRGIMLGNWYDTPIAPRDIDITETAYQSGECPVAESLARESINLPTNRHVTKADVERIVQLIKDVCR